MLRNDCSAQGIALYLFMEAPRSTIQALPLRHLLGADMDRHSRKELMGQMNTRLLQVLQEWEHGTEKRPVYP